MWITYICEKLTFCDKKKEKRIGIKDIKKHFRIREFVWRFYRLRSNATIIWNSSNSFALGQFFDWATRATGSSSTSWPRLRLFCLRRRSTLFRVHIYHELRSSLIDIKINTRLNGGGGQRTRVVFPTGRPFPVSLSETVNSSAALAVGRPAARSFPADVRGPRTPNIRL